MRHSFYHLFLLGFIFTNIVNLSAQDTNNQTLLWRIQKNGMEKPSFLFGTMHISDKKAFNFRDSLYIYLEQAEAFALEFNPDSANQIIAAYMSGELNIDEVDRYGAEPMAASELDTLKTIVSKKDLNAAATKKEDKPGLIDLFVNRLINNQKKQAESMNTFMDAFLYEIAGQNGKKIYGLEELEGKGEVLKAL